MSRFGTVDGARRSQPPSEIGVETWNRAYLCFYRALSGGRSPRQFGHALKNTRDEFDGFFDNGRIGWRSEDAERAARPLTPEMQSVFEIFGAFDRAAHWELIAPFHALDWLTVSPSDIAESIADVELLPDRDITSRTEGGRKIVVSSRPERDPLLRAQAIRLHGARCTVCAFDFGEVYGDWGQGFCEVHHVTPLGSETARRRTDPLYDLVVLCANCHRMVHRRREITLTIKELRGRLRAPIDR